MIQRDLLGRYEYIDPSINSKKYWHLVYNKDTRQYTAKWGRIGQRAQETIYEGDH